ncbi:MAG: phosphotransferase [Emcibacteraceae bacterium]|nr:phosphotransferase [Emcibacteraceae bacterium]
MSNKEHVVPNFDEDQMTKVLKEHYGVEGKISMLVAFEDQNAMVDTGDKRFVLKIANQIWNEDFLQAQIDVMSHLKTEAPTIQCPGIVETLTGKNIVYVDGFAVRLLTFLEGEMLTKMPRSPALYQDAGRFLGQYTKAMETFPNRSVDGSDPFWKLDNVTACKKYLPEVIDEDARDRIERLYAVYEKDILPRLGSLRKAVIHGDANEQNFLLDPNDPTTIIGLIDFGELQHATLVNDLAISMAYGLLGEDDIETGSKSFIKGYTQEFPLLDEELEIIYYLMAMRLVTNITMTSHSAKVYPENEYILIAQKPARELLKKMEEEKYIIL